MAGLVRKRVTVRGKKKTYQRTVMVRSNQAKPNYMHGKASKLRSGEGSMGLSRFMKSHGKQWLKITAAQGLAGGAGAYAGYHAARRDKSRGAALGSLAGGLGATVIARRGGRTARLERDYNRLGGWGKAAVQGAGVLANLAGHGVSIGAIHGARRGIQRLRKRS